MAEWAEEEDSRATAAPTTLVAPLTTAPAPDSAFGASLVHALFRILTELGGFP